MNLLQAQSSNADTSKTITEDNARNSIESIKEDTGRSFYPIKRIYSPRTATILSTLLPGAGQAYNRKYWKMPIIYALGALLVYYANDNNKYLQVFAQAYKDTSISKGIMDTLGNYRPELKDALKAQWMRDEYPKYSLYNRSYHQYTQLSLLSPDQLLRRRDTYLRSKQLNIIAMVGLYLLNILDAHVDAHLKNFDIDENLTFNLEPKPNININAPPGIALTVTYRIK